VPGAPAPIASEAEGTRRRLLRFLTGHDRYFWGRIALATVAVCLAAVRFADADVQDRMDPTVLLLLGAAVLVLVLPWDRLTSFSAGGVSFSLDQPQVQGALEGIELDRVTDQRVRDTLARLSRDIERARGSRVLWIDDYPHELLGLRRLFRALGIEVIPAPSSAEARKLLDLDNDFDLVITDVQREERGADGKETFHGGVDFVVSGIRTHEDKAIRCLPVIFYAAYDSAVLRHITEPARRTDPEPELSNAPDDLLLKAIRRLADVRSDPISVGAGQKRPT
jgi:CheY-like chemotaxis protein